MAIPKEEPLKNGFSFADSHLPRRKLIWSEDLLSSLSYMDRELFYFPPIFSFLLSSDLFIFNLWPYQNASKDDSQFIFICFIIQTHVIVVRKNVEI